MAPELVAHLEILRGLCGDVPLSIVSGHRCSMWNRKQGGAGGSMHLRGMAADIPRGYASLARAETAGFQGIGTSGPWATHVDVRADRARWKY